MNRQTIWSFLKKIFNWTILKETYTEWSNDKASGLAAGLAYYAATAVAPLVVGLLAIVGLVVDTALAQEQLVAQVRTYVGAQGAEIVETIITNADRPQLAQFAGLVSLGVLLWSASNIFAQLVEALDTIWGVQLRRDLGFMRKARHRLFPLLVVAAIALLLLLAVVTSASISAVGTFVTDLLPGGTFLWQVINVLFSLVVITLLFGVVFKVLPDVEIAWRDVWPGAALTALLFVIGQFALGWYLGRQSGASLYGAAGSLLVLLLWFYYAAQIFLFGAEFTQVYATRYGEGVGPAQDAVGRDQPAAMKPAALAANKGTPQGQSTTALVQARDGVPALALSTLGADDPSLGGLAGVVAALVDDLRTLVRQEIELAQAEMRAMAAQLMRGAAYIAGGGLALYAGVLLLLFSVPWLIQALTVMPLWLATLLIGLLALIGGWLIFVSARKRLKQIRQMPKQTIETLRQDVEVVKEHLTS